MIQTNNLIKAALLIFTLGLVTTAHATEPDVMLRKIADSTLDEIRDNQKAINKDSEVLYSILRKKVIPHVDFNEMALWIAGKRAWKTASSSERAKFIDAFETTLLRTYSHFLLGLTDEQISFEKASPSNRKRVQISGKIRRSNGDIISVNYRLVNNNGTWYIYDMVADGVSLLRGFQAQFSDMIRQEGLNKAISELQKHNKGK